MSQQHALPNIDIEHFKIRPKQGCALNKIPTRMGKDSEKQLFKSSIVVLQTELKAHLEKLYARAEQAVLIVLQAMDAAGKDSTIRRCFGPLNPQRCAIARFEAPNNIEKRHDFLWREHQHAPKLGTLTVFNRSHYEAVLIERVKKLAPGKRIEQRYHSINDFERMLTQEGTTVLKFYLHVSKDYQRARLLRRLRRADKRWKFDESDVRERAFWEDYIHAYEQTFYRCSTDYAPWYIIPAERRWYRDMVITQILINTLRAFQLTFPQPNIPDDITIN
ncbi:MAG: PPK2 family polyphosphate kinase [Pseudomonadota bacterium]|nr:PPK2 family polyphosphate kinase [Pseudomonadota bacterium]